MAKKHRIPKKVAGVKVPKGLRKSKALRAMMSSDVGRDVLANALKAGAGAAAAVLMDHRDDVGDAANAVTKKGASAVGLAREAMQSGFSAAMEVVRDTIPSNKKSKGKSPAKSAQLH
ncbi:hypothetical protein GOB07_28805 [Sinorhizobium meliloti]|jgi:hypothetical protein|uniref:hypothetical protein n=1 Tax=Rhizobium meliloti TaxID=382 RepID=UPI000B49D096|nr:hypothetical protein [Sinorhizobium meliloti]ASP73809.1 hypothetical protein CDO28_19820 [Sinorhizobium meliloti]MDE3858056.1 hypothetical protein [Sinorhizobium meliloti]MDW9539998.1 hypothetical protein [Sinorhizobium meliloti]MDW9596050.1 hypothetical protein [Sinorhizobium meliloti]MDX0191498.1 hypothetical protein [Sinorhizobium meliloti]